MHTRKVSVVLGFLVILAGQVPAAPDESDMAGWWHRKHIRLLQTNLREIDADLDPVRLVHQLEEMGANAVLFSCGGIRAFYQTKLKYHKKAVALKSDLAVDMRKAAREHGLLFIARCDMSKADVGFYKDNPDWFQCDANGVPHEYNGLHICCPNGSYYRDYSHKIIAEIIERVQPDAIFFNMFGFTGSDYTGKRIPLCHCKGCRTRYQDFAGEALPDDMGPGHRDWGKYQQFRRRCVDEVARDYRSLIESRSQGRCAFFTYHELADMRRMEANSGVYREPRTNFFSAAQSVGCFKTMHPDKPCCCAAVHFLDIPYRYASEPAALTGMRLVQALAHGGELDFYVLGTLDQPDRRDFGAVKKWFTHYGAHADKYFRSRSVARTALVRRGGDAFDGAYRLLIDLGIPFDLVDLRDDRAREGFYSRYGLIWYPGMLASGSNDARLLEPYVSGGGVLVNTCDADRRPPKWFGVGRKDYIAETRGAYWRLIPREAFPREPRAGILYVFRGLMKCEPLVETRSFLGLIPPQSYGPPELAYYTEETDQPGLFIHVHGKGRVVFFPWSIDGLYERYVSPSHRELVSDVLEMLQRGPEPARVLGDRAVMVTARRSADGSMLLVNLINLTGHDRDGYREPEPMHDVDVSVALPDAHEDVEGKLLVGGGTVKSKRGVFRIPKLELFETLALTRPHPPPDE